jgi:nanoRNase/pAp phosphatase (c-di-AMP/oligoRNAs hydrolase)
MKVSFRSSKDYQEVATMAEALGGGGHQYASAAVVQAEEGDKASEIVLGVVNKVLSSQPSSHPSSVLQAL